MVYTLGKTGVVPEQFEALNGAIETFKLTAGVVLTPVEGDTEEVLAAKQADLLTIIEVLKTRCGQPVISSIDGKIMTFSVEQPCTFSDITTADGIFENVKSVQKGKETSDLAETLEKISTISALL